MLRRFEKAYKEIVCAFGSPIMMMECSIMGGWARRDRVMIRFHVALETRPLTLPRGALYSLLTYQLFRGHHFANLIHYVWAMR